MTLSSFGNSQRRSGDLTAGQIRAAGKLFYCGWAITLLYFPSGLLHFVLGAGVYGRDLLLGIHFCAGLYWLLKTRKLAAFARRSWLLLVPAVFVLPAVFYRLTAVEALTFSKWTVFWLDWIIMGGLAPLVLKEINRTFVIFAALTALLLAADLAAGSYERIANHYLLDTRGEKSDFGVEEGKELTLQSHLRAKGLQRDVFSYSNLMAMSCVAGLLAFISFEEITPRFFSMAWIACFGVGMFLSGGRSAFFGVAAAGLATIGYLTIPEMVRRYDRRLVLGWFLFALIISVVGVGELTEAIGSSLMRGSHIGNSASAYARDANWTGIMDAIERDPVVLVSGGPIASLADAKVDPIYHWADNEYLWLVYHSSIVGLVAMFLYFLYVLGLRPVGGRTWVHDGLILFLLFVMGEAIARESLTFIGCMPMFLACGAHEEDTGGAQPRSRSMSSSRRSRGSTANSAPQTPVKTRSDADEFARRVRSAARRRE
jgi:hypothetical protein